MNRSGFTMIEVIAALVLISIISAVTYAAWPKVGESEFAERLLLKSNLRYARQRSMDTTNNWSVVFSGNSYTLQENGTPKIFPSTGNTSHSVNPGFSSAPGSITFSSPQGTVADEIEKTITFAGGSSIIVHSTGAIP